MRTIYGLVFFATGWGPTKGGINSFNFDLCCALGKQSDSRSTKIFCIYPGTASEEEINDALNNNVKLLPVDERDFNNCKFNKTISENIVFECEKIFWFGHDVITGKQACTCRDIYQNNSEVVIFHHMNYSEYYAIGAAERTARGEDKEREQKQIFKKADYAIAVGPKLFTSLNALKIQSKSHAICTHIIPGLADIEPIQEEIHNKTILFTGRLENDNDPIKQYSITIYAVSDLFKNQDVELGELELKLYGLDATTREELHRKINELKNKASGRAGCIVPVKPLEYTSDRKELFEAVRNSSIVIMPSISEGFGLAGFEGIAAGVPTIVSKNSGLYEFLKQEHIDSYIKAIRVVGGTSWETPGDQDIANAYQSFKDILKNYAECKQNALMLRQKILELGYTWEKTAIEILDFLKISKTNDIVKLFCSIINAEMQKKYLNEIISIANKNVDFFAQQVSNELKIDKQLILSLKVDTIFEIPYAIISTILDRNNAPFWRFQTLLQKLVLELIKLYLKEVTDELKKLENCDTELSGVVVIDEERIGANKIDRSSESFDFSFRSYSRFYKDIVSIMENAAINAVLSANDKNLLKSYHQELKKLYNVLNFDGLSVMVSAGEQIIPLDKVYASMSLKSESRELNFDFEVARESEPFLLDHYNKRIIIKGDPGSGKSTYLKKQLLTSCDSDKKYMYIFFKVSKFTKWLSEGDNKEISNPLSQYVYHILSKTSNFSKEHIEKLKTIYDKLRGIGGIVYYIDGLDEVQDSEQKKKINQLITAFVEEARSCRYILTSRKVGLDEEFFKSIDFAIEEIAPLSKRSIKSYIKNWYEVVGQMPGDLNHNYIQRANELIESIASANNYQLLNLAGNPLLLTIIVILHHHGINPPNNRTTLYNEITKTLLVTWIEKKDFKRKYSDEYLNNFFSRVAFEIVTNDYNTMTIPESKLKAMYLKYLSDRNYDDEEGVDSFIEYISGEAGIFPHQGFLNNEKLYGFLMHRQITEYYAAIALENKLNHREIEFSSIINESKWTEVSILMGGYMSLQSDAGQDRVNSFMKKLFKTKSKPIEDFKYNILLILKWISNNTFINKDNLESLLHEIENIFRSSNRYRVFQFCDDLVSALNNEQCKKQICKLLNRLLDDADFIPVRNASVIINVLLKNKDLYGSVIEELTEDRIISSLKQLIEHRDFYMLLRINGCYHTLFMHYFIKCINENYISSKGTNVEKTWHEYTSIYANAVCDSYDYYSSKKLSDELTNLLKKTEDNKDATFKNQDVLNEYIHMLVLYTIGFDIAIDPEKATSDFKDFCKNSDKWNCKPLIDSAIALGSDAESSIGNISSTYVDWGIRFYHKKDKNAHKLTIFLYNRETERLEKYKISLENNFCLADIKSQIDENNIPLTVFNCLEQLSEIEMPQEKLLEIFNLAYENGRLLTNSDWHQSILEKINNDNEAFYKYYDTFKRRIRFDEKKPNPLRLKGELKTYYKYFAKQREKITASEIKKLIALYKSEENLEHKNVIYDILYDLLHSESDVS